MPIRVEQLNMGKILGMPLSHGGEEQQGISQPIIKTKKQKKSMASTSKYKVTANGSSITGVVDYITPSMAENYWTFLTDYGSEILVSGNVIIEENK